MVVKIPFGDESLHFKVPESCNVTVINSNFETVCSHQEPEDIVKSAVERPVGTLPLNELARGKKNVSIIISDCTRPTPTAFLLPFIIGELKRAGLDVKNIVIVVANGLHDPSSEQDLKRMLGDYYGTVKVVNHNADDHSNLVNIGTTSRGTPVFINRYVSEADLKISIGCIEPHHSAGWSGGAKNVVPGIAGRETIYCHHKLSHNPGVELGAVDGNPFRADLEEAGRMAGIDFILNVILNEKREIIASFAGDLILAHRSGVEMGRSLLEVEIKSRPGVVIVSPGGAPRDRNFWQAEGKALTRIKHVVRPGGTVILVARLDEGIGKEELAAILKNCRVEDIIDNFKNENFSVILNKAFRLAQLLERASLYIVTEGIKKNEMFPKLPIEVFYSLDEAVNRALGKENDGEIVVIPKAPQVIVKVNER